MEVPVKGGRNPDGPKVAKFLVDSNAYKVLKPNNFHKHKSDFSNSLKEVFNRKTKLILINRKFIICNFFSNSIFEIPNKFKKIKRAIIFTLPLRYLSNILHFRHSFIKLISTHY
jgi:hypothetical protein